MAISGVLRPGHIQIRVLDMDEAVHFYRDVLGLEEMARGADGRVYLKTWDERDHHCLAIRYDPRVGLDRVSFKVEFEETRLPGSPLTF